MVRIELVTEGCICSNEFERRDRDEAVQEAFKELIERHNKEAVSEPLLLHVSFFNGEHYHNTLKWLQEKGYAALYGVQAEIDRVIRIKIDKSLVPLFDKS